MVKPSDYHTRQRQAIIDCIAEFGDAHMTAMDIVTRLHSAGHPVGLTTVYRCLDRMVQQGAVRRYTIDDGVGACYQYVGERGACANHFHLKCVECGQLIHLGCEYMAAMDLHLLEHHDFRVDNSRTVLYGVCGACAKH